MAFIESPIYNPNIFPDIRTRVSELSSRIRSLPFGILEILNKYSDSVESPQKVSFIPQPKWIKEDSTTDRESFVRVYEQAWMEVQMLKTGQINSLIEYKRYAQESIDDYIRRVILEMKQVNESGPKLDSASTYKARIEGLQSSLSINMVSL